MTRVISLVHSVHTVQNYLNITVSHRDSTNYELQKEPRKHLVDLGFTLKNLHFITKTICLVEMGRIVSELAFFMQAINTVKLNSTGEFNCGQVNRKQPLCIKILAESVHPVIEIYAIPLMDEQVMVTRMSDSQ